MSSNQIKQQTDDLFLVLFYGTPVLRNHTALRIALRRRTITVKEPTDAILILLQILTQENDGYCFQGELEDLVRRWYGVQTSSSFDKSLAMLDDEKCISKEPNPSNKRENKLRLTSAGRQLTVKIRAERTKALQPLFTVLNGCPSAFRRELPTVLAELSNVAANGLKGTVTKSREL
jgi:DNA-binding MarR family transcriptional regulator